MEVWGDGDKKVEGLKGCKFSVLTVHIVIDDGEQHLNLTF